MKTVNEMLEIKGHDVWSISPSATVYQSIELMAEKEVGALTVLNDDLRLVGIISERDYARKVILKNKSSREIRVEDIMTRDVIYVGDQNTVDECIALMSRMKIRHLPVKDGDTLTGIITVGDLLKFVIDEQTTVIEELESYIKGETGGSG